MEQAIYIILYVIFAVSGSTLLKFGASDSVNSMFNIPLININVSIISILGFFAYGISFLLYTVLLSKYELSFISPLTVGVVYIALMITAFIFFKEPINLYKIFGSALILFGILIMIIKK